MEFVNREASRRSAQQRRTKTPLTFLPGRICLRLSLGRGLRSAVVRRGLALALALLRRVAAVVWRIAGLSSLSVTVVVTSWRSAVWGRVAGLPVLRGRGGVLRRGAARGIALL